MNSNPHLTSSGLFAYMVELLCRAVAGSGATRTPWGTPRVPLPHRKIGLYHHWLRRLGARFATLVALAREGRVPRPRARAPRPMAARPGMVAEARVRPARLPRGFGWLVRLVPETAVGDTQLRMLLADPEMGGLVAAAPGLGRMLRPLCRALGVAPPPGMLPAPAPAPAERAASPRRAAARRAAPPGGPNGAPPSRRPAGGGTRTGRVPTVLRSAPGRNGPGRSASG